MNLAVTSGSTWTSVKRHSFSGITMACLGAMAIFAATTFTSTDQAPTTNSASVRAVSSSSKAVIPPPPAMTYYIVDSEELLQSVQQQATMVIDDNAVYAPGRAWKFSILLARTPAEAQDAIGIVEAAKASWRATGASGLEVVDLRNR